MEEEQPTPYDFTDWQICEIDLPDGLSALADTVRNELRFAFRNFGQGRWAAEAGTGKLTWQPDSDIFGDPPPPVFITVDPRQLVPLLIGDLADELSTLPKFNVETQ